ncbi:roadblock/LC7 domain-containing protein [Streptomyces sp. NBC_00989]|uniref:roadblock/LC7 domain-containing protein n=1 Tax=Streptomyces sp. NBC_00989 TaxID=2903705 RepID=UPI003870C81B|nr:roadblock/LC7 domain-containing protein [Streptomyces sp. NBC_00989]
MNALPKSNVRPDLSWVLDELVKAPEARHAVLLSADGLAMAASKDVGDVLADTIAASTSGLQALSRNCAQFVSDQDTPWQQTMVQYRDGFLFVITAGNGSFLVASAGMHVEVANFSYLMADTVKRLGDAMAVEARQHTGQE